MNALNPTRTHMPPRAGLPMPEQSFAAPFTDPAAPGATTRCPWLARLAVFVPAIAVSLALAAICFDWFRKDGFVVAETAMVGLVAFSSFGIAVSVFTALVALWNRPVRQPKGGERLNVALLMPIYAEDVETVFRRVAAMRAALTRADTRHDYSLFILSDTPKGPLATAEWWHTQRLLAVGGIPLFYRRRARNIHRKTGNIADWVEGHGAAYEAFITLDADSLMAVDAVEALADDLAADPACALVQSVPRLMGGASIFGRFMQFSNNVYGPWLARGLRIHCGVDGNYWGHNAIIRTRAFAACCGLPLLRSLPWTRRTLGGDIKSHDFVEAALLIRAGWTVRIREDIAASWEKAPQTLVDHILRDRRWCQGNLQHLGLLFSRGFSSMSRFHMLQGAMAYLASVVWFALLMVWAIIGTNAATVLNYFSPDNPLFPRWPEMDAVDRMSVLLAMAVLLLTPKVVAVLKRPRQIGHSRASYGFSVLVEILASVAIAPTMMVQHVLGVLRTFAGRDTGWAPQNRDGTRLSAFALLRFHFVETVIGAMLCTGIGTGLVSWWLAPIGLSLLAAPALSGLSAIGLPSSFRLLATQETLRPAQIITDAETASSEVEPVGSFAPAPAE